jgi:hypothetical protein
MAWHNLDGSLEACNNTHTSNTKAKQTLLFHFMMASWAEEYNEIEQREETLQPIEF